jgi:hypothetical protein
MAKKEIPVRDDLDEAMGPWEAGDSRVPQNDRHSRNAEKLNRTASLFLPRWGHPVGDGLAELKDKESE